ncbi:hypothetical protein CCO02nite_18340 [Cellulomonas composti]|uniref:Uncharacterized protein n=1 Tax=Cellulomonas composti TaxID=266130 RepID=A0A511JB08_9CELL|nr:hypothetical protein CCO02nite_18340 [Cellulomonas composti]
MGRAAAPAARVVPGRLEDERGVVDAGPGGIDAGRTGAAAPRPAAAGGGVRWVDERCDDEACDDAGGGGGGGTAPFRGPFVGPAPTTTASS